MTKTKLMLPLILCAAACLLAAPSVMSAEGTDAAVDEAAPAAAAPVVDESYRVREEDILKLDVWGEERLTNVQMLVTPDGNISVPYLGSMRASGLTQGELTQKISQAFEDAGILIKPVLQLAVMVLHRPTVRVLGDVFRPGDVEFKEGDRLLDAIANAGSYRETAHLEKASLLRKGADKSIPVDLTKLFEGDLTQNYELQKGDTIYVPPENYENKIYVLGHVLRPGIYSLKDRTTVMAAISLASGPTERGSLKGTVVVRGAPSLPTRVECNLAQLLDKGDLSQDIVLEPGDVVLVPETNRPDWNKVSGMISTIMNLTYLRRYGLF